MEIFRDTGITSTFPVRRVLSAESAPKVTPYEPYHEAGGVLSEFDYTEFIRAGTAVMRGEKPLEAVHMRQGRGYAGRSELLPTPEALDTTAAFYGVLREAGVLASSAPGLEGWAKANSDQVVFDEALLVTEGESAYRSFRAEYPHIFKDEDSPVSSTH